MKIGVVKETYPDERRVALVPDHIPPLAKKGFEVLVEAGAGKSAGYIDAAYQEKGATISQQRSEVFASAEILLQVRCFGANPQSGRSDLTSLRKDQIVIGCCDPLSEPKAASEMANSGAMTFAMELMPRITRAQSMDILSSMATIAGYKAVMIAANELPKMFPMMMTAAGTISPAKVFVIGAGVAGLQAIATAKKNGAIVHAYDIRPAVREQIESLGGKFVHMDLEAGASEDRGGYARAMDEEFYRKQRELMTRVVAENDVVITTAAIPGKKSPVLVTTEMVEGMRSGSMIVDLAAERGGNCELTQAGKTIVHQNVTIFGPVNLPSTVPYHASQMYSKNLTNFLRELFDKENQLRIDMENEVIAETMITRNGEVPHPRIRDLLGLPEKQSTSQTQSETQEVSSDG